MPSHTQIDAITSQLYPAPLSPRETSGLGSFMKRSLSQLSPVARAPRQGQNVAAMSLSVQGDHAEAYRLITRSSGDQLIRNHLGTWAMEDCSVVPG